MTDPHRPDDRRHPRPATWLAALFCASALACAAAAVTGCTRDPAAAPQTKPKSDANAAPIPPDPVTVTIGIRQVTLQLRSTDTARRRAFADLSKLPAGEGMLLPFAFPRPIHMPTSDRAADDAPAVPVEAIGLDPAGRVVSRARVSTGAARWFSTPAEARYLVLLPAGEADAASAREGDVIALPPRAVQAADAMLVPAQLKGQPFRLEVVATEDSRQQGLMWVWQFPPDVGMAFTFKDAHDQGFWMKNTSVPLDIVYVAADGRVVSVRQLMPFDENSVPSGGPARFAIELNQGTATRIGLRAGDLLSLPPAVTNPADLE